MATLDRWTTLAVELAHTRALDETRGVAIQVGSSSLSSVCMVEKMLSVSLDFAL